ncbi:MAG: hypothetical protein ACI4Q3_00635 [Kiritimatiellia bacterium]
MKTKILAIVSALILAAGAAESISGVDSLAIGNLAGKGGSANRTVVIGSGAGAYMTGGDSNLFVGAASGLRTKNVKSSVALGHYAMRGATNLTRCVGIGDLAFKEAKDINGATWINGQFYAGDGRFWIRPGTGGNETNSPIYYANGTLYLNAQKVVAAGGGVISGGTAGAGAETYDWYVSSAGDDANDGRTAASAKRTIDAAWDEAAHGDRIAVLPGTYYSPSGMSVDMTWNDGSSVVITNKAVDIVATSGPDYTFIDGGGVRSFIGNAGSMPTVKGFTVRNIGSSIYSKTYRTGAAAVCFDGCRMAWTNQYEINHSNCGMSWCVFTNCDIYASMVVSNYIGGQGYDNTFVACNLMDSRIKMEQTDGNKYKFGQNNAVERCLVHLDGAQEVGFWMNSCYAPLGGSTTWTDSTLIATNCTYKNNSTPLKTWKDCLVIAPPSEIGTWPESKTEDTLFAAYENPIPLGPDGRPNDSHLLWRFYGYGSKAERTLRDALVSYLIESGYIAEQ